MRVCINAGHCPGIDSGAVGQYSTEADIVKQVGGIVVQDLINAGVEAILVQDDSLAYVCNTSDSFNADFFVSIHCNAAENQSARGAETWYYYSSNAGRALGSCIQNQIVETFGLIDRGMKSSTSLYVLKNTDAPACLVELGFISNPDEENFLNNNIEGLAHAVARGITDAMQ
jgi:N-acetylmuramoyl-L-alanine amidase